MRIIYDYQIFSLQEYGGISRYVYELALKMLNNQQDVNIISPIYINQYLKNFRKSNLTGFFIKHIPKTGLVIQAINAVLFFVYVRIIKPDVVHETYYYSVLLAPKRTKVILTVYDMIHEKFSDCFLASDRTSKCKLFAVKRADHIICISEQTKRDLIELFSVPANKISVVYLGFTLSQSIKMVGNINSRPFLFYVGLRSGYKNFNALLHAYAESVLLKQEYDLICFGGGQFSTEEYALFNELGLLNVKQVSGDDELLACYYQSATLFIYPSLYEGFGIPPLEAMNFNCPVVCSNVSSIPEVVGDAALLFDPYEVSDIKSAIEQVVLDEDLRLSLIARGQARLQCFSWERCAEETLAVYRQVLSS